jgi:hypothetical protein
MSRLVIRHGLSQANNRENFATPAFGHPDAGLMEQGVIDSVHLQQILAVDYSIDPSSTIAAVSELRRTWETANLAGFHSLRPYQSLNEVSGGLTYDEIAQIRETKKLPAFVLQAAEVTLNNPPEEEVWFTHGLLIAGMCKVLGVYQEPVRRAWPRFCEIRELPL